MVVGCTVSKSGCAWSYHLCDTNRMLLTTPSPQKVALRSMCFVTSLAVLCHSTAFGRHEAEPGLQLVPLRPVIW